MAYAAKVLQGTLPATAGSTDFTNSGFGTPTGALIFLCNAVSGTNPIVTGSMSVGFWDGTTALCCAAGSYHNVTTMAESRSSSDSHGAIAVNPAFPNGRYADYTVASITDGIRLTIDTDNTGGSRFCTVVLFKGTTMKCVTVAMNNTQNATVSTPSLGLEPESAFFATIGYSAAIDVDNDARILSFGVAESGGTHRTIAWSGTDNVTTSVCNTVLSETRCTGQWYNDSQAWGAEVTAWGSDDLTLTTRDGTSGSDYVFILAADSSLLMEVGTITTPASTGTDDVTTTGVNPSEVLIAMTTGSGTTLETGQGGEGICIGVSDGTNDHSHRAWSKDAAGTCDSQSKYSTSIIDLADSAGDVAVASMSSLGSEKFTLNYSTVPATARKGWYVAFGSSLAATYTIACDAASFVFTGVDAALVATQAATYTIACDAASFVFTGVDASLNHGFFHKRRTPWKSEVKLEETANTFLGTPSIVEDSSGVFWCSFNYFGSATSTNTTDIYKSTDGGSTWSFVRSITGLYHGKFFLYGGGHYILGTASSRSNLVLYYSTDEWATAPSNITISSGNYVMSSTQSLEKDGYLFFAVNDVQSAGASFADDYLAMIFYVDTADITNVSNWRSSNQITFNQAWAGSAEVANQRGFIEGNIVEDGGDIVSVWRIGYGGDNDKAGLITSTWDSVTPNLTIAFDDSTGFIDVPGGAKKFSLNYDSASSRWFSLGNYDGYGLLSEGTKLNGTYDSPNTCRNELWLSSSSSLSGTWTPHCRVLRDEIESTLQDSYGQTGFQYPNCIYDGTTLKLLVRTAYDGAANEHDSNRITYHEIYNVGKLISTQSASDLLPANWSGYASVSVSSADVASNLAGFSVLIDLAIIESDQFWDAVREDGADIRVSDSSNSEVPFALIEFCRQSQVGRIVCKIDLSSTVDTEIRIWAGNASAQQYANSYTYGSDNAFDSNVAYALEISEINSVDISGRAGAVVPFAGSLTRARTNSYFEYFSNQSTTRYYSVSNDDDLSFDIANGFTVEAIVDADDVSGGDTFDTTNPRYVINKGGETNMNYGLRILGPKLDFIYRNSANTSYVNETETTGSIGTTANHHIAATHDGTHVTLYVDGASVVSSTTSGATTDSSLTNTDDLRFGAQDASGVRQFEGSFRSIRIHATARSADWLNASYGNLISPGSFAIYSDYSAILTALSETFSISWLDAGLKVTRNLNANSQAFAVIGNQSYFNFTRKLAAATGTLTLTGNNANLAYGNTLVAESGAFTLTGVDAGLKASRKLVCAAGTFSLTGNDAGLLYDPGGNTYSLSCAAGSFTLTGIATGLTAARKLPASLGTFTLTGIDAGMSFNRVIVLSVGTYTLTGIDAGLSRPKRAFDAENGTFTLTGVAASFGYSGTPTATFIKVQSATIGVPKATGYITA